MAVLLEEGPGRRSDVHRQTFLDTVRIFLEFSGLISLFLYGLGWVQAVRFYDSFGLDPEDVVSIFRGCSFGQL